MIEYKCTPNCRYFSCNSDSTALFKEEDDSRCSCDKYDIWVEFMDDCKDGDDHFTPVNNRINRLPEEEILKEQVQDFIGIVKETTDYHAKQDYGKAKLSLVPRRIIWDVAAIREYGNNKYPDGGPDNWRGVETERYRDAAYRHFLGYLDDPKSVDSESGLPHLWHLACNIAFLCEMEDIYLSKNPEVVERLKKAFDMEDEK